MPGMTTPWVKPAMTYPRARNDRKVVARGHVSAKAGPGGPRRNDHARLPRVRSNLVAARDSALVN
jgi:hypothetical protein